MQNIHLNKFIVENLLWFAGSLVLAFFVWIIATSQLDPISRRQFSTVPVQITVPDGLIIISDPPRPAAVIVRAQQSALELLTSDDMTIRTDLTGLGPGTHTIPLTAQVARLAVVEDIVPRQITITLDEYQERLVPVQAFIPTEPPQGYRRDNPVFDVNQVLVSGPAAAVDQVIAARATIDLNEQRTTLELDTRLFAVDADGQTVSGITMDPQIIGVQVDIQPDENIREVRVTPNIIGTLPTGYVLTSFNYDPKVVLVSGDPSLLNDIPSAFFTAPIDLTGRTASFELEVPVDLPAEGISLVTVQRINVSVGIAALTATRQFDGVQVETVGVASSLTAEITPRDVSVVVTGPETVLDTLTPADLQVVVDLTGFEAGLYTLRPTAAALRNSEALAGISILPEEVGALLIDRPTATPRP